MSREYWVPEDLWRIVKSYLFYKEFYIGDVIYGLPKKDSNFIHYAHFAADKYGLIVDKTGNIKMLPIMYLFLNIKEIIWY